MRIVAGEYRGRTLRAPKGQATRPTTDRVREAVMSTLASARPGLEGAAVLDAFAGSGALGLEALSRGARWAGFYEKDAEALRVLQGNIAALGLARERYAVQRADVLKSPPRSAPAAIDIVFLDPPYALAAADVIGLLAALDTAGLLAAGAIAVYEHARQSDADVAAAFDAHGWRPLSHKRYGDTTVDLFDRPGQPEA